MRYLTNSSTDPWYNMAFDEYCLEQPVSDVPVFYLWQNRPSVIIGLNQNAFKEVNVPFLEEKGILLARRVTGGGAVYHDLQNLNYTIVGRSEDLDRDYEGYVHYMLDALRGLGVDASMSGRNDILVGGRKVSGYAKRVWRDRLMIHGTLMYDVDVETLTRALDTDSSKLHGKGIESVRSRVANLKEYIPAVRDIRDLQGRLQDILSAGDEQITLSAGQLADIRRLRDEKFALWEWNWGHSPLSSVRLSAHLDCGSVESAFDVVGGEVRKLSFCGDFLGRLPSDELAARLEGCRYERSAVLSALASTPAGEYFDGAGDEEFTRKLLGL